MSKSQWIVLAGLFVCAAVALSIFLGPDADNQVPPDISLTDKNANLEDSASHPGLPIGSSRRTSDHKQPGDLPSLDDILAGIPPPFPESDGPPEDRPAEEWRVWRQLYTSLDSLSLESVAPVQKLQGLLPGEADAVLQAGQDYLRNLASIGEEMDSEIRTRFPPRNAPPLPDWVDPDRVIQLPYGVSLREILEPEGFYERYEARRELLLSSHREYLEQLIGPAKLAWLDSHVKTAIAPNVRVVTKARRLPPEEWPASFREQAEALRDRADAWRHLESSR